MSRSLRILYPGALYHVTSRGNKRETIYLTEDDRKLFLSLLKEVHEKYHWILHAYCLMGNHYHLLVETPLANLPKGMRHLNGIYTQQFNREHNRVGHVFQGRYKSILIEKESYLLEVARYIVLNPVRAGMVSSAGDWFWSSYLATVGRVESPSWLSTDWIISMFGDSKQQYQKFIENAGQSQFNWKDVKHQIYLGSDEFINEMQNKINPMFDNSEIPSQQYKSIAPPIEEYIKKYSSRDLSIKMAYLSGAFTMKELGCYYGLHYSRISKIIRHGESEP